MATLKVNGFELVDQQFNRMGAGMIRQIVEAGADAAEKRMAERTKQDAALWKYFLDVLSNEIETQMLAGNRINLGRFAMFLAIRGSFASEDDEFDPSGGMGV